MCMQSGLEYVIYKWIVGTILHEYDADLIDTLTTAINDRQNVDSKVMFSALVFLA